MSAKQKSYLARITKRVASTPLLVDGPLSARCEIVRTIDDRLLLRVDRNWRYANGNMSNHTLEVDAAIIRSLRDDAFFEAFLKEEMAIAAEKQQEQSDDDASTPTIRVIVTGPSQSKKKMRVEGAFAQPPLKVAPKQIQPADAETCDKQD